MLDYSFASMIPRRTDISPYSTMPEYKKRGRGPKYPYICTFVQLFPSEVCMVIAVVCIDDQIYQDQIRVVQVSATACRFHMQYFFCRMYFCALSVHGMSSGDRQQLSWGMAAAADTKPSSSVGLIYPGYFRNIVFNFYKLGCLFCRVCQQGQELISNIQASFQSFKVTL